MHYLSTVTQHGAGDDKKTRYKSCSSSFGCRIFLFDTLAKIINTIMCILDN